MALTGKGHRMLSHVHEEYGRIIQGLKEQMGNDRFSLFLEMIEESNEICAKTFDRVAPVDDTMKREEDLP